GECDPERRTHAEPGAVAGDPEVGRQAAASDGRRLALRFAERALTLQQRVDRRVPAAGDGFGIFLPVAWIEGLEAPWSGVLAGLKGCDQDLELDDSFSRQDAVGFFDLPRRFVGSVI